MAREERRAGVLHGLEVDVDPRDLIGQRAGARAELEEAVDAAGEEGAVAAGGIEHGVAGLA
jgi:hypothetical protein